MNTNNDINSTIHSYIENKKVINFKTINIELNSLIQTHINGKKCPHCQSHNIILKGDYKGRKRYRCNECKKYYNDLTGTPFDGMHDLEKVKKYMLCLIQGLSIRKAASMVGISIVTSFNWRHRLLGKFCELPATRMKNVIELKQIKIPFSAKGQRKPVDENLISSKVAICFASDRTGHLDSDANIMLRKQTNPLLKRIKKIKSDDTMILSEQKILIRKIMQNSNCRDSLKINATQTPILMTIIQSWENWMSRFHGVATKYLRNYLHWFDFLENSIAKQNKLNSMINILLHRTEGKQALLI